MSTSATNTGNAFGSGASSAFGNTATTSAFSQPAFGQSTFGQPQPTQPASAFVQPTQTAFGQSTTATTPSVFGQPQSTQPAPSFGQSAFAQPQQPSAFGQASQPQSSLIKPATGAFGSLTGSGTTNAFGGGGFSAFSGQPSAFGAGATNTPAAQAGGSVFGQSTFGAAPAAVPAQTSVFGAPVTTSAFGAPSAFGVLSPQQPVSAFGGTAFGAQTRSQPVSAFNTQNQSTPLPNTFSNLANAASSAFAPQPASSAFGGLSSTSLEVPKVASAFSAQPLSAFPMSSPSTSSSFPAANSNNNKGKSVVGPPDFANAKSGYQPGATPYDQQLPPDYMSAVLPPLVLETFKAQKFEWGKVPEWVPPLELR
jgi:nucleoporin NUP42